MYKVRKITVCGRYNKCMIKKILEHKNKDGLILFTKTESSKYGLVPGKKVTIRLSGKHQGSLARLAITVLD